MVSCSSRTCLWCILPTLVLLLAGCGKSETGSAEPASDAPSTGAETNPDEAPPVSDKGRGLRVRPNVKEIFGRWGLVITQPIPDEKGQPTFRDICLALIEFKKTATSGVDTSVLAAMPESPEMSTSAATIQENQLRFQLVWGGNEGDFQGELVDGVVRGSLNLPGTGILPAMLRPTEETSFEGWDFAPSASGLGRFQEAIKSKEQPTAIIEAAKEMRGSALSMHAYDGLFGRLSQYPSLDEAQLRKIYDDYLDCASLWGARVVDQSRLRAAITVTVSRRMPELALEWIKALETVGEPLQSEMKESIQQLRDQAHADIALRDIKSEDETKQSEAYAALQGLLKTQRYNPEILEALGIYAVKHDDIPTAKQHLAEIVALPMLESILSDMHSGQPPGDPTPRERLLTIWETEKGSVEGFDEFIESTYQQQLEALTQEVIASNSPVVPETERQRSALVELFTGTGCPPCVAADVALSALSETYPTSNVIVLQYHQHIPAPDPLTNQDSEDRFAYYQGEGTPTTIVDGVMSPEAGASGFLHHVPTAYAKIRALIDPRLKMAVGCKLQVSAALEEGVLKVSAAATEFDEKLMPNLRLRLALVEDNIHFRAPNGIREHHYVVREMLGGAKGVGARDGNLEYSLTMPLTEVEQHLQDYLRQFEAGRNVQFTNKPTDLGAMSLAVWVQNDSSREILQSVIVPVAGSEVSAENNAAADTPTPSQPETKPAEDAQDKSSEQ